MTGSRKSILKMMFSSRITSNLLLLDNADRLGEEEQSRVFFSDEQPETGK